ncbi:unnamed protein product [Lymnaea stagnalis]|uniref:Uncharacterized protein n=1 Tax=Lymnaea stagnalis TaxID=6523 RepID=A0AAV2IG28_LYMST
MLTMYTTYTEKNTNYRRHHFNEKFDWDSGAKLRYFAYAASYIKQPCCHYHLFSQYPMPQRVLGLAYIGSACYRAMEGSELWATGTTSGYDWKSGPMPSLQMNLVFVHELGAFEKMRMTSL